MRELMVGFVVVSVLAGCAAEKALDRAAGFSEAIVTKGLDKLSPEKIFADAMVDATNPETEGNAEVYQAWGVRWRNQYTGLIARGNLHVIGSGGATDDPQLREMIREKLGDPTLKQLDAVVRAWKEVHSGAGDKSKTEPASAADDPPPGPGAAP